MNLFAGLEKFGIKADNTTDLFEDEKKPAASADGGKTEAAPTEDSFLLDKAIRCTVCDKVFKTKNDQERTNQTFRAGSGSASAFRIH